MNVFDTSRAMTARQASRWQRALVFGAGLSGRAAARLLSRHGIAVLVGDDRDVELDASDRALPGVEWRLGEGKSCASDVDALVLSPGVPLDHPVVVAAREAGIPVVGEVEVALQYSSNRVLAITGSNGKSTTTALVGAILEGAGYDAQVCGNIGRPVSDCVSLEETRVLVIELSSFQLESLEGLAPLAAALLNVTPDHLDRYDDFEAYRRAKVRIFENMGDGDIAVLNRDDEATRRTELPAAVRLREFSRRDEVADGCYVEGERVYEVDPDGRRELFRTSELRIPGVHNLENAMAAALLARAAGCQLRELSSGLNTFAGLTHRLEWIARIDGVEYYNDSKATNPAATQRTLEGFPDGSVHLILGGRDKGTELAAAAEVILEKARRCYLIGEAAPLLAQQLPEELWTMCGNLSTAIHSAARAAASGEVVVLSPACASFDQFRDFEHRGQEFRRIVVGLDGERS